MPRPRLPHTNTPKHDVWRQRAVARNRRVKEECLSVYGGRCQYCGEKDPLVLVLDHVDDDGYARRHAGLDASGIKLVYQLKKRGWPSGYQLLCANCNLRKERLRVMREAGLLE